MFTQGVVLNNYWTEIDINKLAQDCLGTRVNKTDRDQFNSDFIDVHIINYYTVAASVQAYNISNFDLAMFMILD